MTTILDVPYRSQWDDDANKSTTDCGPACLAMVLDYYDKHAAINELLSATGVAPGQYVGFGQLQRVASSFGITFEYGANHSLNDLKRWIDAGKPPIALIKYSFWSEIEPGVSTQDSFTGPHFVVVVGYGDGNIYINDPNYWPPRRNEGHRKAWSEVLFNLAWSNVRTPVLPNPNNSVIVPTVGRIDIAGVETEPDEGVVVIEYTVQAGDTWSGLAAKYYGNQTRYPEIMAFNGISTGSLLYIGQRLRIPLRAEEGMGLLPGQPIVFGEGALQMVDADLVSDLKEKWVSAGKLDATADETTVLRAFLEEVQRWESGEVTVVEYVVQPGDSWAGIAGDFYGDQMRYPEIIAFNELPSNAPLRAGQRIRIPLNQKVQ